MKKTLAIRQLERAGVPYELLTYQYDPENLDVHKIARENKLIVSEVFKTLVVRGNHTGLLVAVIAGDQQLNRKALAQLSGNKKVNLVPIAELQSLTGYIRGGCSPLGMKGNPPVYVDITAQERDIWINAGKRGLLMKVSTDGLLKASKGELCAIGESE